MISNKNSFEQQTFKNQNLDSVLPEGSCDLESYKILQNFKNNLSHPNVSSVIFHLESKFNQWIIVRQNIEGQESIFHLFYEPLRIRFLSAQKQSNNIGCNFVISKTQKPTKNKGYVGKLRGNFLNTQFFIYDHGQNPKKKVLRKRKQLAHLRFGDESFFSQSQKYKIQVIVPKPNQNGQIFKDPMNLCPIDFIPNDQKQNLLYEEFKINSRKVVSLDEIQQYIEKNTQNIWSSHQNSDNTKQKKSTINLGIKGCQSQSPVLIFQRRTKNTYRLKFGYPLNMVQSFGISLALVQKNFQ